MFSRLSRTCTVRLDFLPRCHWLGSSSDWGCVTAEPLRSPRVLRRPADAPARGAGWIKAREPAAECKSLVLEVGIERDRRAITNGLMARDFWSGRPPRTSSVTLDSRKKNRSISSPALITSHADQKQGPSSDLTRIQMVAALNGSSGASPFCSLKTGSDGSPASDAIHLQLVRWRQPCFLI